MSLGRGAAFCGYAALKPAIGNFLVMTMAITIGEQKAYCSCRKFGARSSVEAMVGERLPCLQGRAVGTLYLAGTGRIPTGRARVRGSGQVKGRGPLS